MAGAVDRGEALDTRRPRMIRLRRPDRNPRAPATDRA